ncbi:MAG: BLUF domain-containing protein [Polynucleobacter sp.]|jgi:hypothetical protein|nr:BLUF domain-containing protein [Polynucleobacter sp.]
MNKDSNHSLMEISYVSKATQEIGLAALVKLFDEAFKWNQEHGLTGVLFYENGYFSQILEGHQDNIILVWERISRDYRHFVLRQLTHQPISERAFPKWSLRFYGGEQIAKDIPYLKGVLDGMPDHDIELLKIMRMMAQGK